MSNETVSVSAGSIRAMLTQMLEGGRSEISILLGEMATMPLSPVDETAMRKRIEEALAGLLPDVTAACKRHLGVMRSCVADVALIRNLGLEPSVVSFIVASMGALDVRAAGCGVNFVKGTARIDFDMPLGEQAVWNANHRHSVYIGELPGIVSTALLGRIEDAANEALLSSVLSHPVLDTMPLRIRGLRILTTGSCILEIAEDRVVEERQLEDLLAVEPVGDMK
jgi:hypothetical protein